MLLQAIQFFFQKELNLKKSNGLSQLYYIVLQHFIIYIREDVFSKISSIRSFFSFSIKVQVL